MLAILKRNHIVRIYLSLFGRLAIGIQTAVFVDKFCLFNEVLFLQHVERCMPCCLISWYLTLRWNELRLERTYLIASTCLDQHIRLLTIIIANLRVLYILSHSSCCSYLHLIYCWFILLCWKVGNRFYVIISLMILLLILAWWILATIRQLIEGVLKVSASVVDIDHLSREITENPVKVLLITPIKLLLLSLTRHHIVIWSVAESVLLRLWAKSIIHAIVRDLLRLRCLWLDIKLVELKSETMTGILTKRTMRM